MAHLFRDEICLLLQHLDGEKFKETVHTLERESGLFFNMKYLEDTATKGDWEEVDKYISGFTKYDDNKISMKIFFEIRKQNYLEVLDRGDISKAMEILNKDLIVFSTANLNTYMELSRLRFLENFREKEELKYYGDTQHARNIVFTELKTLIEGNPVFHGKLQFPTMGNSRLRTLMEQSFYYQHKLCWNRKPNARLETLYENHTCLPPNFAPGPNEINEQSQCCSLRLADNLLKSKVSRLMYTNSGDALLALASNAVHMLWKWQINDHNQTGKATALIPPQLWEPRSGVLMKNEKSAVNPEDAVPCLALSKNDSYVMSASGGKVSFFNLRTFKKLKTILHPPPAPTSIAFHPEDNNIVALGMEDSAILIYNAKSEDIITILEGHRGRITGLLFSLAHGILVSSGADSCLFAWKWNNRSWKKLGTMSLQIPSSTAIPSDTCLQLNQGHTQFLYVHATQIFIYRVLKLERINQWLPPDSRFPITHAAYSCDSQLIYASFSDGSVAVLTSTTLQLRCRILPSAHIPSSTIGERVYPLVIAAHPSKPNQIALGLTNGAVHVLEPLQSEGNWDTLPPPENGAGTSKRSDQFAW